METEIGTDAKTHPGALGPRRRNVDDIFAIDEEHFEGTTTKAIEDQTAKIPSVFFLTLAVGSMALSATLAVSTKRKDLANFVGLWAPTFLLLGLYNKIVKTVGSDRQTPA